jgi:hypothetical protein
MQVPPGEADDFVDEWHKEAKKTIKEEGNRWEITRVKYFVSSMLRLLECLLVHLYAQSILLGHLVYAQNCFIAARRILALSSNSNDNTHFYAYARY